MKHKSVNKEDPFGAYCRLKLKKMNNDKCIKYSPNQYTHNEMVKIINEI